MATVVKETGQAQAIREMFSRLAPFYDLGNRVLSLGQDQLWRCHAASLAQPDKPGLVLDIAAGTGDLALAVAGLGSHVIALDFCSEMVDLGVKKSKRSRRGCKVSFVLGDALHLPFPGDTFDAITIGFGIRNIPDLPRCLNEIKRVLKSGGRLVILELFQPVKGRGTAIQGYYLKNLVPTIGHWLTGQGIAYQYLTRSIHRFASAKDMGVSLENVGLNQVRILRLSMGAAMIHMATK